MLSNPERSASEVSSDAASKVLNVRRKLLFPLRDEFIAPLLELLVAISGALRVEDYAELFPVLWRKCIESSNAKVVSMVSIMLVILFY